jgi:hypothetical protein
MKKKVEQSRATTSPSLSPSLSPSISDLLSCSVSYGEDSYDDDSWDDMRDVGERLFAGPLIKVEIVIFGIKVISLVLFERK